MTHTPHSGRPSHNHLARALDIIQLEGMITRPDATFLPPRAPVQTRAAIRYALVGFKIDGRHPTVATALDFEGHFLSFGERRHSGALNRAYVHEDVFFLSLARLDETKTALRVEELYCSDSHDGLRLKIEFGAVRPPHNARSVTGLMDCEDVRPADFSLEVGVFSIRSHGEIVAAAKRGQIGKCRS